MNLPPQPISMLLPKFVANNPTRKYGKFRIRSFFIFSYPSQITLLFLLSNLLRNRCDNFLELLQLRQNARLFILG